ncbi:hypothetical protein FH972_005880 [Carpinus fangiana]|uniref:Uncharacterized protein n=1 Tax=Carpinus fangiana TaxID=176857 RepID=A0A5N6QTI9_9ROSI|nr:hypothetical protein FH972_005880 [Carpinus fangiana]
MPPQAADLTKIGREGFGMLEQILDKKKNPKPGGDHRAVQSFPKEEVMDSNQAARLLQGVCITEYRGTPGCRK